MEYPIRIFLHVLFGIFWAGGAVVAGFFIHPSRSSTPGRRAAR